MYNGQEIIQGWFLHFEETSNNVYKVRLTDGYGRIAEKTGINLDNLIDECKASALEIDKQLKEKNQK